MKIDFHFYKDRFIVLDDMISSNQRRFKIIESNDRDNPSLLYRHFQRYKIMIYHSLKNIDDIK